MYTLIMVDADIANPVVGNATHPLVFWLVTNIREGNMSTGTDIDQHWGFFKGCKMMFVNTTFTLCPRRPRQSRFRQPWTKQGDRNTT